jgi:hypothetical protein
MVPSRHANTTGPSPSRYVAPATPALVVWSVILFALAWLPVRPVPLAQQLPGPFEAMYKPWLMFPVLAIGTLFFGWCHRGDRQSMWNVIVGSMLLTTMDFFVLQ